MVAKKSMTKVGQKDTKAFYNSNKFKIGGEGEFGNIQYIMFVAPDCSYEINFHTAKFNKKEGVGFKGSKSEFGTSIKCKSYDNDGNYIDQASCCVYSNQEGTKELLGWKNQKAELPILVFGTVETDDKVKALPLNKVSLKTFEFKYIECALASVEKKILKPFEEYLKKECLIPQDLEGEELREALVEHLKTTIIQVKGVQDTIKYPVQEYSFHPFVAAKKAVNDETNSIEVVIDEETGLAVTVPNKAIASFSKEYEAIINYKNNISLQNDITAFIEDFEANIDSIFVDWTEAELSKYLIDDVASAEDVDAFREGERLAEEAFNTPPKKVQQVVKKVVKKVPPVTPKVVEVIEDSLSVDNFGEEDFSIDIDENDFHD